MADSPMRWVFEIFDRMSNPAKKIHDNLKNVNKSLHDVDKAAKHAEGSMSHFFKALVVERLGEKAVELAKDWVKETFQATVHAVAFKTNMERAFTALDPAHGREYFEMAERFADVLGVANDRLVQYTRSLLAANLRGTDLSNTLKAAADLFVLNGKGDQGLAMMDNFVNAMASVAGKSELAELAVNRLQQAGINAGDVWRQMAADTGHAGMAIVDFQKLVEKSGGKIPGAAIIQAAQEVISKKTGKPLGAFAQGAGGDISSMFQRIENRKDRTLASLAGGPFMKALEGTLRNIERLLSPGGGVYKALTDLMNGPVAAFFKQFSGPEGAKRLTELFDTMKTAIEGVTVAITKLVNGLIELNRFGKQISPVTTDSMKEIKGAIPGGNLFPDESPADTVRRWFGGDKNTSTPTLPKGKTTGMLGPTLNGGIHVDVHVPPGMSGKDAETIANKTAETLASLSYLFEGAASEQGAA